MKRANVLQLTFILVGIVYGIFSVPVILSLLLTTIIMLLNGGSEPGEILLFNVFSLLAIALQIFACWLLITRSGSFAASVQKRSGIGKGFSITANPNDLLHILFVVVGIYLLLTNLAPFLKAVFMSFQARGRSGLLEVENLAPDWITIIINLLLPLILLMFGKPIADYFAGKVTEDPIVIADDVTDPITDSIEN
jgi:hypothetical protein